MTDMDMMNTAFLAREEEKRNSPSRKTVGDKHAPLTLARLQGLTAVPQDRLQLTIGAATSACVPSRRAAGGRLV